MRGWELRDFARLGRGGDRGERADLKLNHLDAGGAFSFRAARVQCALAALTLNRDGDGETEGGAVRCAGGCPQMSTMRFDDRPADRKSQAKPIGLGREEGVEDALRDGRVDPLAGVLDSNLHTVRFGAGD